MAGSVEKQFMKPVGLTVGADNHVGLTGFSVKGNGGETYKAVPEAGLAPTRSEPVKSDQPAYSGQFNTNGINFIALQGTNAAAASLSGVDALTGSTMTVAMTDVVFKGFSANPTDTNPGQSSLEYECATFVVT